VGWGGGVQSVSTISLYRLYSQRVMATTIVGSNHSLRRMIRDERVERVEK
jgi:hypothetical protein